MYFLNNLFSNETISALGWTLVNIMWQGSLIALLLALALKVFRNFSSQAKYLMAISSLSIIVCLAVFNFISNYETSAKENTEVTQFQKIENVNTENNSSLTIAEKVELLANDFMLMDFLKNVDDFFPFLINIWLAGVLLFMLKFSFGLLYFQRIKRSSTQNINHIWIDKFCRIEQKLSLSTRIRYLESAIVKIPMVLGYLKPLVIFPAGMLTGIPENQIEAIVAHELAHIKRHDFLVNILQSVVEIVFFFHPAVWYISSVIRAERENCCDDIAIALCDESLTYAKALVSVQELIKPKIYHAVAFSGQKKHLLNRVKRVIMKPRMKSNLSDRIVATLILVAGVVIATLSISFNAEESQAATLVDNDLHMSSFVSPLNPPASIGAKVADIVKVNNSMLRDTTKNNKSRIKIDADDVSIIKTITEKDGKSKEMKFKLKNGEVSELYIDGKKIPEKDFEKYQPEIDETIKGLKQAKIDIKNAMKDIENVDFEKIKAEVAEAMKDFEINMASVHEEIAKAMEEAKNVDIEKAMKDVQVSIEHIQSKDFEKELFEIQKSIAEIEKIDMEEVKRQMEEVRKELQNIDLEQIKQQVEKARQEALQNVDMEKIQEEIMRVQEEIANMDLDKINFEVEENLKEIDKEKMLKEMQNELQKLEELELEKKE
ncbi:MAG TPA: M56 family metallopeptidase [Tenuifilaceae bacterium]|nr:M56 family metallopeptidase [Tenuifilaceae bacterium]HPE17415.1 M56 family metallopeptidase [Tenuifilaceae bacterium]HPJ46142.1 M56 family metallopeptidase [Tenuifilaceae bacterium]HPQ34533.1 M56 family metallopeptidase [Tenuifilaceae bacterium]HRX66890.1 M56 family metallopeptidase [Tenuifilaceae bacterium]